MRAETIKINKDLKIMGIDLHKLTKKDNYKYFKEILDRFVND